MTSANWRGQGDEARIGRPSERGGRLPDSPQSAPNPLARPEHWWRHRRAANQAEREEYDGWTFAPHPQLELAARVRERYAALYDTLAASDLTKAIVDDYVRRRALAVAVGRNPLAELRGTAPTDEELDGFAATVREADRGAARRVYAEGQARFAQAVADGRWPLAEWRQWREETAAASAVSARVAMAAAALGLRVPSGSSVTGGPEPGGFVRELANLTNGGLA